MRLVGHDTRDRQRAGSRIGGKRVDDDLGLRDRFRRGREHLVDDRDLRRVDRQPGGEAVAACRLAIAAESGVVAKVDIDRVDRRNPGGRGAGDAERARQPVWIEVAAVGIAIGFGAELGGKILGAPGQCGKPRARTRIGAGDKQRRCGLGGDRNDFDLPRLGTGSI